MQTRAWVNLLDLDGKLIGELDGVKGGSIEASIAKTVKASGTIQMRRAVVNDIDWSQVMVQPWREVDGHSWPLGVFLANAPEAKHDSLGVILDVELQDRLALLDRVTRGDVYALPAGTVITTAIRELIEWCGVDPGTLDDSDVTLRTALSWPEPDTTVLRIINDLLEAGGFFSLWCDGFGRYQVESATAPASRPIVAEFVHGERFSFTPEWSRSQDLGSIPNVVRVWTQGDDEKPPLRAEALNEDPDDPLSLAHRSQHVHPEEVEASSQEVLQGIADRRLSELRSAYASVQIEHPWRDLALNSAVRFAHGPSGVDGRHTVIRTEMPLDDLVLQRTTLREVVG